MKNGSTISRSKELFDSGFGCAEAVLMAVSEHLQIESHIIPRIATGFCGGVGRTSGMCGAVSGAVLALSLVYGRDSAGDSKDTLNGKIQDFINSFEEQFDSLNCTNLIGVDLSKPEGPQTFKALNLHPRCLGFVEEATRKVLLLIN